MTAKLEMQVFAYSKDESFLHRFNNFMIRNRSDLSHLSFKVSGK